MKEKILITKNEIKSFQNVDVYFLDSVYTLPCKFVTDIRFEAEKDLRSGKIYVTDGFIEFSSRAFSALGKQTHAYVPDEERLCIDFLQRIQEGTDIFRIGFSLPQTSLTLDLPCDPLLDCEGNVIEYSDCPSYALTEESLRIFAGKASESIKRTPVIYSDVCKNWERVVGKNYRPDLLQAEMISLRVDTSEIGIEFEIYNSKCPLQYMVFCFENYTIHSFNVYLEKTLADDISISRMANGNLFVLLKDCGICIECEGIAVYYPD